MSFQRYLFKKNDHQLTIDTDSLKYYPMTTKSCAIIVIIIGFILTLILTQISYIGNIVQNEQTVLTQDRDGMNPSINAYL